MGEFHRLPRAAGHEELYNLITELAERVQRWEVEALGSGNRTAALNFSDEKLATIATSIYRARVHRANQFNPDLFGEPAWDMLLDLFIQKVAGRRTSTTSLCLGGNVPQSTGLRYIARLEAEGIVYRFTPFDDRRLTLVNFTEDGFKRMREYISSATTRFVTPRPG